MAAAPVAEHCTFRTTAGRLLQRHALTCDWGRSEVFSHKLPRNGATFDAQQDTFLTIPRPTDADADASGRLFVTSWKNGGFSFERPDVGFVR